MANTFDTAAFLKHVRRGLGHSGRLRRLRGLWRGETAVIVTCGPSLNDHEQSALRAAVAPYPVIAVKQAYERLERETAVHVLNPYNYQPYHYGQRRPLVAVVGGHLAPLKMPGLRPDLLFEADRRSRSKDLAHSLAVHRDFSRWDLSRQRWNLPWGPGMVYDLALPLALHAGCTRVVMIGWDIGDPDTDALPHF